MNMGVPMQGAAGGADKWNNGWSAKGAGKGAGKKGKDVTADFGGGLSGGKSFGKGKGAGKAAAPAAAASSWENPTTSYNGAQSYRYPSWSGRVTRHPDKCLEIFFQKFIFFPFVVQ